jgi:hypothetical protein
MSTTQLCNISVLFWNPHTKATGGYQLSCTAMAGPTHSSPEAFRAADISHGTHVDLCRMQSTVCHMPQMARVLRLEEQTRQSSSGAVLPKECSSSHTPQQSKLSHTIQSQSNWHPAQKWTLGCGLQRSDLSQKGQSLAAYYAWPGLQMGACWPLGSRMAAYRYEIRLVNREVSFHEGRRLCGP